MRCRQCNYPLWNIKGRLCPECGEPFIPSEYEFVKNSVKFMCPHCTQDYYGEGDKGHLVPTEFDCVSCERHITMDETVLLPLEGFDESVTRVDHMPWRSRGEIGFVKGWFKTIFQALFTPTRLMRLDPGNSVGDALLFMFITHLIYMAPSALALIGLLYTQMGSSALVGFGGGASMVVMMLFLLPVVAVVVWALVAHLLLIMTGTTKHGLRGTMQAMCYSSAADVMKIVPCLNFYLWWASWIWWVVSATLMVTERQSVRGWRASLAVITPPALAFLAIVGFVVFSMFFAMNAMSQISSASMPLPRQEVTPIGDALVARYDATGAYPRHAFELVIDGEISPKWFAMNSTMTQILNIPVGLESLESYQYLKPAEQAELLLDELDALPDDVIAHRFGDFVFTYHGVDPATDDPELWIMMASPDPDTQYFGMFQYQTIAVKVDGSTLAIDADDLDAELENPEPAPSRSRP